MCKTTAKCQVCGRELVTSEMQKVKNPKSHYGYICSHCLRSEDYYSSNEANSTKTTGTKEKTVSITTGFEFETSDNMDANRLKMLEHYGFKATSDGSISGSEYKSPIFNNLNGIAKLMYSMVDSEETGAGFPNLNECGCHVNVWSSDLNEKDWQRIQNYYNIIFKPLYDAVANDANAYKLFGRGIKNSRYDTYYYRGFGLHHETMVNMQSNKITHPRIELRICAYANNKQFMNCLRFANDFMKTILVNFSRNYMTDSQAQAMGKTSEFATAHNRHKAEITAQKLVKVYNKYLEKAMSL